MVAFALQAAMPQVPLMDLWLPIVLAAALVWILSALFWTVSPHHKKDFGQLPGEDQALSVLRQSGVQPGHYAFPYAGDMAQIKTPEFQKKLDNGPVGILTVTTPEIHRNMGKAMIQSVVYYVVVTIFVAYVTSRTVAAGSDYLAVFRVAGTTAFLAYGVGVIPDTIWFGRGWTRLWKHLFDALVYALFTGGVFGWRWPGVM